MAHVQKSTRSSIGGLTRHYERFEKENGEYIQFGNQEIDISRIHLNYNLAMHQQMQQLDFIKKRTSEVHCPNRKELNVMCSWIVTQPQEVTEKEQEKFFQETYNFLENRYGKENIISAYVHLDETTPHLHFAFVPITYDNKKEYYKVCAKEVINKTDLKTFHSDLSRCMSNIFQRDIGILNQATEQGNKSIQELKADTIAKNELNASTIVSKALDELKYIKDNITSLQAEYELKKGYLDNYNLSNAKIEQFSEVAKVNKKILGEDTVTLPLEKWNEINAIAKDVVTLRKTLEDLEKSISEQQQMTSLETKKQIDMQVKELIDENKTLLLQNQRLNMYLDKSISDLNNAPERYLQRLELALRKIPDEIKEPIMNVLNEHMGLIQMDIDIEKINYSQKAIDLEQGWDLEL